MNLEGTILLTVKRNNPSMQGFGVLNRLKDGTNINNLVLLDVNIDGPKDDLYLN